MIFRLVVAVLVTVPYTTNVRLTIPEWLGYDSAAGVANFLLTTVLFSMLVLCYAKATLTDPGSPKPEYRPSDHDEQQSGDEESQRLVTNVGTNAVRPQKVFCERCDHFKPPRTHHCSWCGKCRLKMDHHCPWVENCVGFYNYKPFFLFLFYTSCVAIHTLILTVGRGIGQIGLATSALDQTCLWASGIIAVFICMSVGCLFCFHFNLIANNQTTLENSSYFYHSGPRVSYDLGLYKNIQAALGTSPMVWLWPTKPEHDGHWFESKTIEREGPPPPVFQPRFVEPTEWNDPQPPFSGHDRPLDVSYTDPIDGDIVRFSQSPSGQLQYFVNGRFMKLVERLHFRQSDGDIRDQDGFGGPIGSSDFVTVVPKLRKLAHQCKAGFFVQAMTPPPGSNGSPSPMASKGHGGCQDKSCNGCKSKDDIVLTTRV